jgi:hypothetical protein
MENSEIYDYDEVLENLANCEDEEKEENAEKHLLILEMKNIPTCY